MMHVVNYLIVRDKTQVFLQVIATFIISMIFLQIDNINYQIRHVSI